MLTCRDLERIARTYRAHRDVQRLLQALRERDAELFDVMEELEYTRQDLEHIRRGEHTA